MKRVVILIIVFCLNSFFLSGQADNFESRLESNAEKAQEEAKDHKTVDILITGGTLITMPFPNSSGA